MVTILKMSVIYKSQFGDYSQDYNDNAIKGLFESPYQTAERMAKPLFVDATTSETLTGDEHKRLVFRLAALLRSEYGVLKDDVVCLIGPNNIYTSAIHHATISLAAVLSPANVMYNSTELAHQLKMTEPRILVAFDQGVQTANDAVKKSGSTKTRVVPFSELIPKLRSLAKASSAPEVAPVSVDPYEQHAYYCFSSGTSGLPKGVITTHSNILANVRQMFVYDKMPFVTGEYTTAAVLPMSHIFGLCLFVWSSIHRVRKTVVFSHFDLKFLLDGCTKYNIDVLLAVPPIILLLGKHPLIDQYPKFKQQMRYIISGAAPLSKSTQELAKKRLPNCFITQGYGLTETSPVVQMGIYDEDNYDAATVGWSVPGTEVRLVDVETGKDAKKGERGELWVRGPQVMKGYLKNEKATKEALHPDGWFMTGDVAVVDGRGQFQIVDRIKELIKSKGHQVAPAELEALLVTQSEVLDSAVVGVPDEYGTTELPRAYVVLAPGADPLKVVRKFNSSVAKHKRLWGGIVVIPEIPKSTTGKILRRELKERKGDVAIGVDIAKL